MTQNEADRYLLDHADFDRERQRLNLLSKLYDPLAQEKIQALRLKSGDNCLEVGFGNGSMLTWLAEQVWPNGKVFGLDREPRFVSDIDTKTIDIIRDNVMTADLSDYQVDLVYARLLLEHVSDPFRALNNLARAVKSGGCLFVMATDFTPFGALDPSHARAAEFDATWRKLKRRFEDTQLMDLTFGPIVPGLFQKAGLINIEHEVKLYDASPDSDFTKEYVMAASSLAEIRADFADDCRTMIDIVADPTFSFHYQNIHSVVGRKPI
jgi:SAM-dependent methyltransferase